MTAYDVIGDIHGHADALERLLRELGYRETGGAYRHPDRTVVFLGDLIDRGPEQLRTLEVVRDMVEAGTAQMVLGNHEFNAVAWATRNDAGEWSRPHSKKNHKQHLAFLGAVGDGSALHEEWVQWFRTLPMWLDLDGLRVVHACWDPASMAVLGGATLTEDIVTAPAGSAEYEALEIVSKGPEVHMGGHRYLDKDGHERYRARLRWWDPDATTLDRAAEIPGSATGPDGGPMAPLPDTPLDPGATPQVPLDVPVLYGHYWRSGGRPRVDNGRAGCLDWSVARGGHLVAYQWSGETDLTDDHVFWVR